MFNFYIYIDSNSYINYACVAPCREQAFEKAIDWAEMIYPEKKCKIVAI